MSSLLAGSSSITPWIENVCFRALVDGPSPQRARLVQVVRVVNNNLLVIHDGKTLAVAVVKNKLSPTDKNGLPTRGCIVRISDWNVSLAEHCCTGAAELLQSELTPPRLCLSVGQVEVLGAHGIGIVGNPTPVQQSVDVRRALYSLETKGISIQQQLQLVNTTTRTTTTTRLGNVQELFASGQRDVIETLLAVPKGGIGGTAARKPAAITPGTTTTPGVVLGDVAGLLESLRNNNDSSSSQDGSFVEQIMNQSNTTTSKNGGSTTTTTAADGGGEEENTVNGVVLGNVRAAVTGGGGTSSSNSMDALFAAAAASKPAKNPDKEEHAAKQVEPYGIRERIDSRASVISLSGISHVLRSFVSGGRRVSSAETEQQKDGDDNDEEEAAKDNSENEEENNISTAQQQEDVAQSQEDESDSDSEQVVGISDMLISQTQEGSDDVVAAEEEATVEMEATEQEMTGVEETVGDEASVEMTGRSAPTIATETVVQEVETVVEKTAVAETAAAGETVMEETEETIVEETIVETQSVASVEQSKKRPLEENQGEEDEEDAVGEDMQYATQPATQPTAPDDDFIQVDDGDDEENSSSIQETENTAKVTRPKKPKAAAQKRQVGMRPKKKRRKGMLTLWKEQRARRQEKLGTNK